MILQLFPELSIVFLALMYSKTNDTKYARLLAGAILTLFIGVVLKETFKATPLDRSLVMRPKGAKDCHGLAKGNCEHQVGMPSIHSMLAGYYVAKLRCTNTYATMAMCAVPFSRLSSADFAIINHGIHGCHTWSQITVGFGIGLALGNFY